MNKESVIKQTEKYVKNKLEGEGSGHDWWHVQRVCKNAVYIGLKENADLLVVQLAALLHDIDDWKVTGKEDSSSSEAKDFLKGIGVDDITIEKITEIIDNISFSSNIEKKKELSLEGMVVQDADRLDAMGAIGIARCFARCGKVGNLIYNPNIKPKKHFKSPVDYKKSKTTGVNHFYEKLLLLKDLMNTKTARKIAENRHAFMEKFLEQFFKEWE